MAVSFSVVLINLNVCRHSQKITFLCKFIYNFTAKVTKNAN